MLNIQDVTPVGAMSPTTRLSTRPSTRSSRAGGRRARGRRAESQEARRRRWRRRRPEPCAVGLTRGRPRAEHAAGPIKVASSDPARAAAEANAIASAYAKYNVELKLKGARDALTWLAEEAGRLRAKVDESSQALQNYRIKSGILGMQEQRQISAQKIIEANKGYLEAQAQRMAVEAKLGELTQVAKDPATAGTIFSEADNPLVGKIKGEIGGLETEKSKLLKVYKEKHPEIVKIDAQIQHLRDRLEAEFRGTLRSVQTQVKVARAREDSQLKEVNYLRREGQELNDKESQYQNLQREIESTSSSMTRWSSGSRRRGWPAGSRTAMFGSSRKQPRPARRSGRARPGTGPEHRRRAGPRLRGGLRPRIPRHHREDSRRGGALPRLVGDRGRPLVPRQAALMAARESRPHPHHPDPVLITLTEPKSAASEAFRTLRTNIQFAGLDQPCRSIVVTSAGPEEGKTTSAANFGVVSAQAGSRVCVVDSDLRRPTLHRLFKLSNARGLTTALLENLSFAEVAQPTAVPNLSILPSGPLPPNPAELVGSHRMRDCLRAATEAFDLVLCDSPPLMAVGDAAALAAQCDG